MKTSILLFTFVCVLASHAFGQLGIKSEPVFNYKHANAAANAGKYNLNNSARLGQIVVLHPENYKRTNSYVITKKAVVFTNNDRNKSYPNYKHQQRVKN